MSIVNLLKYIDAITMLLPLIDKIVSMIEGLFAKLGVGQGVAKKTAAIDLAKATLTKAGIDLPDEVFSAMIDSVVKIKNQTGKFTHSARSPPPAKDPAAKT